MSGHCSFSNDGSFSSDGAALLTLMHELHLDSPLVKPTTNCERRDVDLVKGVKFVIKFPAGKVDAGNFFTVNQVRFLSLCRHVAGA
jgi:hypothetical protein